jgi:precorrin-6A/cobalt-precorrin-6A reductase
LIAGTGEGPLLARVFLDRGWRLRVSVVTPSASRSYPEDPRLEVRVGALAGAAALRTALEEADLEGDPFQWLIDASHPFAAQVTATAVAATRDWPARLLRLERPILPAPMAIPLRQLSDLGPHVRPGERILLAIGARHLREASLQCAEAHPHGRVLPHPQALNQALRAGLPPHHIACCHPTADGAVERALCHRWGIETILCRQSGGHTEALWLRIASEAHLRLLLLRRPPEPAATRRLPFPELVEHVGWPMGRGKGG